MIFPVIECDDVVQQNDKFRILGVGSYKTPDESDYDLVEIEPYAGAGYIDVTGDLTKARPERNWYLDYQYGSTGSKVISLRITAGLVVTVSTKTISVLSEVDDNLFSTDDDLKKVQEDVMRFLPDGKSSFIYKHRAAQEFILDWLWTNGYYKSGVIGIEPYTKSDIADTTAMSDWSTYVCLRMIFQANESQTNDIFKKKSGEFMNKEERAREKFLLKAFGDGNDVQISSRRLIRV